MWNLPYWVYLLAISLAFVALERVRPWRTQRIARPAMLTDLAHLAFNGYLLALALEPGARVLRHAVEGLVAPALGRGHLSDAPLWAQAVVAFFAIDLLKWCIHVTLHRVPFLWTFHKVHHSIVHMDWIGSMRFHWIEIVVYDAVLYVPMLLAGFDWRLLLGLAVFSTVMGHFNHANLAVSIGPLGYVLNNPAMHIWHHDRVMRYQAGCNFGINLSLWDWIFRTAYMPGGQPERLGFRDIESYPTGFLALQTTPLSTAILSARARARKARKDASKGATPGAS